MAVQDAAVTAAAAPEAAFRKEQRKQMGDSTGSMFYMIGGLLVLYFAGVAVYQLVTWIKKRWNNRH